MLSNVIVCVTYVITLQILSAVQSVQERIVVGNALLKAAIVPLPTMHLTLMVMHLADDEQVEKWVSHINCSVIIYLQVLKLRFLRNLLTNFT